MSKVYIIATGTEKTVILEAPSTKAAKSAYQFIKQQAPATSVGVYGAKDLTTFKRTQRTLPSAKFTTSVSDFMSHIASHSHV